MLPTGSKVVEAVTVDPSRKLGRRVDQADAHPEGAGHGIGAGGNLADAALAR
jgi:hypothetical protein